MDVKPLNSWLTSLSSPGAVVLATTARSTTLKILCDQLEHTQANLAQLEQELDKLLEADDAIKGLKSVPEFGRKTVGVLRAE
jgi:transposase